MVASLAAPPAAAAPALPPVTIMAPINGRDSATALEIREGFCRAAPTFPVTPSASAKSWRACFRESLFQPWMASRASLGLNPKLPPSFSRNLPARPPEARSAKPTAASGTATAPLSSERPRSPALRKTPSPAGFCSVPATGSLSHQFEPLDWPPDATGSSSHQFFCAMRQALLVRIDPSGAVYLVPAGSLSSSSFDETSGGPLGVETGLTLPVVLSSR